MGGSLREWLGDQGRSLVGAYLLGLPLLYTMETWWYGWTGPDWLILAYSAAGLAIVYVVVSFIGFKPEHQGPDTTLRQHVQDFLELGMVSFLASYLVLMLFGILDLQSSPREIVRLGLVQVVPLGFGAAVANRAFGSREGSGKGGMKQELGTLAMGAVFFAMPVAPTEEMELMAAHAGWLRLALIVLAAIVLSYVALYEVEFRGVQARSRKEGRLVELGEVVAGYVLAMVISWLLLAGFGHFESVTLPEMVQQTVVLSFIASIGGAAARVVV